MGKIPLTKRKGEISGLDYHVMNFLDCMKTRKKPNADVEIGSHIAKIAHLGNIAYKTGRKIFWDAEKNVFENDPEANEMVRAKYRAPWKVPEV